MTKINRLEDMTMTNERRLRTPIPFLSVEVKEIFKKRMTTYIHQGVK